MIILNASILFLAAFLGGGSYLLLPQFRKINFRNVLMFSGAYLFSITLVHLLPEVFSNFPNPAVIGIFVLAGFFLQLILEFLSEGIEHGHTHIHSGKHSPDQDRTHFHSTHILSLMVGLGVHSFLEGMIVAHPSTPAFHHHSGTILLGIVLHKVPAAFALMTVMVFARIKKTNIWIYLAVFSLASPAGLAFSQYLNQEAGLTARHVSLLYGIVCGTFLFISTTIFFETSPGHRFNFEKLLYALAGGTLAVISEIFI